MVKGEKHPIASVYIMVLEERLPIVKKKKKSHEFRYVGFNPVSITRRFDSTMHLCLNARRKDKDLGRVQVGQKTALGLPRVLMNANINNRDSLGRVQGFAYPFSRDPSIGTTSPLLPLKQYGQKSNRGYISCTQCLIPPRRIINNDANYPIVRSSDLTTRRRRRRRRFIFRYITKSKRITTDGMERELH